MFSNSTNTCSKSRFHICSAESNYGKISIDFDNRKVKMSIRTPDEQEEAYHEVPYWNEVSFISEIKNIKPKSFTPDRREPIHSILLKMNEQKLLIAS